MSRSPTMATPTQISAAVPRMWHVVDAQNQVRLADKMRMRRCTWRNYWRPAAASAADGGTVAQQVPALARWSQKRLRR